MSAEPFDAFVRRIAPDYAHLILEENERLREAARAIVDLRERWVDDLCEEADVDMAIDELRRALNGA